MLKLDVRQPHGRSSLERDCWLRYQATVFTTVQNPGPLTSCPLYLSRLWSSSSPTCYLCPLHPSTTVVTVPPLDMSRLPQTLNILPHRGFLTLKHSCRFLHQPISNHVNRKTLLFLVSLTRCVSVFTSAWLLFRGILAGQWCMTSFSESSLELSADAAPLRLPVSPLAYPTPHTSQWIADWLPKPW